MNFSLPRALAPSHVLFIDARVPDLRSQVDAAPPATRIVVLQSQHDGVAQMVAALHGITGLQSISIVSHGSPSELMLGSSALSMDKLLDYAGELATMGDALGRGGDVMLYGCNVGAGPQGNCLVSELAELMGANVCATENLAYPDESADSGWGPEPDSGPMDLSPTLNTLVLSTSGCQCDALPVGAFTTRPGSHEADFFNQICL